MEEARADTLATTTPIRRLAVDPDQGGPDIDDGRCHEQCEQGCGYGISIMMRAALAGLAYFGLVFAAGFGLGTLRVLALAPTLGEIAAVLLEIPIILAIAWAACRWLATRFDVQELASARLVMGGIAFAVLMAAEIGVPVFGFGRSLSAHLAQYRQLPALIGLAGQVAFAAIPIIQRRSGVDQGPS